jgi:hypothetical protein
MQLKTLIVTLLFSFGVGGVSYADCSSAESEAYDSYRYAKKAYRASDLDDCQRYAKKAYRYASYAESEASSCN